MTATGGTSGGDIEQGGRPLTPTDGWINASDNGAGIQGAYWAVADATSSLSLSANFTGDQACIQGKAAKVDLSCTPSEPGGDCYGEYWGAAIGLNLNQPIDPVTGQAGDPLPYDASGLQGFGFEISGTTIPVGMRFRVQNADGEFCTPVTLPIVPGLNQVSFHELRSKCWLPGGSSPDVTQLIHISWQVVTNDAAPVPYDFCVSNLRALPYAPAPPPEGI